jgi:MFS family permease
LKYVQQGEQVNTCVDLTSHNKKPGFFNSCTIVVAAFLSMMVGGMSLFSFGVFFKPMSSEFGWTRAETSGAFSLFMICSGLLGIIGGRIGDKYRPRLVIIACGFIGGISFLLLSQMNSLWQLYFFYGILAGAGMGNIPPIISMVTRYYVEKRGVMTGITMAGVGVGSTLAAPIATFLISTFGWQKAFLIMGGILLTLVAISGGLLFRHSSSLKFSAYERKSSEEKVHPESKGSSFKQGIATLSFWIFGTIIFCTGVIQQGLTVHLIPAVTDLGISAVSAAGILSVISLTSIVGNFGVGIIIDRMGSWVSIVVSLALMLVGLILLLGMKELWSLYLFAIIFGFSWGILVISRSIIIADLFGLHAHGAITGTILFLYSIGGMIGPLAAGHIFDISRHYQLVFWFFTGLALFTLIMTLPLRKSMRRY